MIKKSLHILICLFVFLNVKASSEIDSLKVLVDKEKGDYKKMELLLSISNMCEVNDIVDYAQPLITLCNKLLILEKDSLKITQIKSVKAESYNNLGYMYKIQGISEKAIENLYKSIELSEQIGEARLMADTYNNLGSAHQQQADSESAIIFFLKSLSIYDSINDTEGLALTYNNLGYQYEIKKEYENLLLISKKVKLYGKN
jgi:tetratricopeptide (TPR) repeat protein